MSGTFLPEWGLFCNFVPGLLAILLGSRLASLTRIVGIGLETRPGFSSLLLTQAVTIIHINFLCTLGLELDFHGSAKQPYLVVVIGGRGVHAGIISRF